MGLVNFTLKLGDQTAVDALREHVRQTGWDTADAEGGWRTRDPDGIAIQIGLVSG